MFKSTKTIIAVVSIVAVLAVGAVALISVQQVNAMGSSSSVMNVLQNAVFQRGGNGMGMDGDDGTYLAEALGITTDELTAAREAAKTAYIDQALAEGVITQAQADALKSDATTGRRSGRGMLGGWLLQNSSVDMETLLANELGISVAELDAARAEAVALHTAAAVDAGEMTQEQADLMVARRAVMQTIDHGTLAANALNMTVDELQAARESGKTMATILEEQGLTAAEFQTAMRTEYEAAVAQAVTDGVITQAQADLLLADQNGFGRGFDMGGADCRDGMGMRGGMGMPGGNGMPGGRGMHGGRGGFTAPTTDTTDTDS